MCLITKFICVCMLVSGAMALEQTSCGILALNYTCHESHIDAMLTLSPSENMRKCMQNKPVYRWWHYFVNRSSGQIHPDERTTFTHQTLIIHDIDHSDEGTYIMDCFGNEVMCRTSEVKLEYKFNKDECNKPNTTTTVSPAKESTDSPGVVLTDTVIVVIAVCAVIIAVVIAGTVLIVVRKKATTNEGSSRLVSFEGGSTVNLNRESESKIYHEIGHELNDAKTDNSGFNSLKLSLLPLECSPALPKRPNQKIIIPKDDDDYATIRDSSNSIKCRTTTDKVARQINTVDVDTRQTQNDDGYVKVTANTQHLKDKDISTSPNNSSIPEYAKVIKRKTTAGIEKKPSHSKDDNLTNYNVVFPEINCSEINKTLDVDSQKNEVSPSDETAAYCNIGAKRRHSKARASRKELQYAVLDHSGSVASLDQLSYGPYDLPDLVTCQYAAIDFDKKAFVAPVRKAPSSWYKRRNKKENKK